VGAGLRVDEFILPVGFAYASSAAASDASGRFTLLVLRLNEFEPPPVPDTARVHIKIYPSLAEAQQPAAPTDSFAVLMRFAPMGIVVDTTETELTR
jgi:hypothetical protein